ncbi:MAG: hypothetical protein H0V81_17670 [Solirubrobacterales bacterium]|nr:hypothetical protein [Solirubrobacterales bacterium]
MSVKEKELDDRFKFGPAPIQTPEDAHMAFLREEISEDEFRRACGKFGVMPGHFDNRTLTPVEAMESAFIPKIPDDMQSGPTSIPTAEERLEMVEQKSDLREEATKNAEKLDTVEEVVKMESNADYHHKLEAKHIKPVTEAQKNKEETTKKAEKDSDTKSSNPASSKSPDTAPVGSSSTNKSSTPTPTKSSSAPTKGMSIPKVSPTTPNPAKK